MPSLPESPAAPAAVRLPANCTTVAAEALRTSLVVAADAGAGTIIDAGEVQNVGQAVLQLLVAARRGAIDAGKPYDLAEMSEAFRVRVVECCLADAIGLPGERASAS